MTYAGPNPIAVPLSAQIESDAKAYSEIASQLVAAAEGAETARKAFLESDDTEVQMVRTAMDKLNAKLEAMADAHVAALPQLSEDEVAKLQVEAVALREQVNNGVKAAQTYLKSGPVDKEGIEVWLVEFAANNPTKKRLSSNNGEGTGRTGSTLPKASVNMSILGGSLEGALSVESFSQAAAKLSTTVADLQKAYAAAAGVAHEDISTVKEPVTFTFTDSTPNAPTYTIVATPKPRKPKGSN